MEENLSVEFYCKYKGKFSSLLDSQPFFSILFLHTQYFNFIYDLIRPCKFSIISLKGGSFVIFSSTFLMECRTVE